MATFTTTEYLVTIFLVLLILFLVYCLIFFMCRPDFRWCIEQRLDRVWSNPTPFFGNVYEAFFGIGLPALLELFHKISPRRSMIGFYYLRRRAVLLRDIRLVNQVLTSRRESFGPYAEVNADWDPLMKNSPIFTGEWSSWTSAAFTRDRLSSMIGSMQEVINKACDAWMVGIPDENGHITTNMYKSMLTLAATVSVRYGAGVLPGDESMYWSLYMVAYLVQDVMTRPKIIASAYVSRWLSNVFLFLARIFGHSYKLVSKSTEQCYLHAISILLDESSTLNPDSLLSWIHADVPKDEAQRQVYHFFMETHLLLTGVASFALVFLGWNLDAQIQLRREINNVLRFRRNVTLEDLERMTYLDAVIEEAQRFASVMRVIDRKCTQEIELRGNDGQRCLLQPGDLVFASVRNLNLDEAVWTRPFEFMPSRFPRGSDCLIAFPGLRDSVAAPFNRMLLKLLLVTAVRKFEIGDGTRSDVQVNDENVFIMDQAFFTYTGTKVRPVRRYQGRI